MESYWLKQSADKPLFEDLLWSRPENKMHAGKLLIIGGNAHNFSAPAEAYDSALKAGVGVAHVLLPDALQKTIGSVLENCEFAPTNKSGSFASRSLAEWVSLASWGDGVLIAGDLGRNSETGIVLELFLKKYSGLLTITKDAVDYFYHQPRHLLERPNTTLVISFAQLQKLVAPTGRALKFSMTLMQLADELHHISSGFAAHFLIEHNGTLFVAVDGKVSTTTLGETPEVWRVNYAAQASVWWLQNPNKPFEALTTSIITK